MSYHTCVKFVVFLYINRSRSLSFFFWRFGPKKKIDDSFEKNWRFLGKKKLTVVYPSKQVDRIVLNFKLMALHYKNIYNRRYFAHCWQICWCAYANRSNCLMPSISCRWVCVDYADFYRFVVVFCHDCPWLIRFYRYVVHHDDNLCANAYDSERVRVAGVSGVALPTTSPEHKPRDLMWLPSILWIATLNCLAKLTKLNRVWWMLDLWPLQTQRIPVRSFACLLIRLFHAHPVLMLIPIWAVIYFFSFYSFLIPAIELLNEKPDWLGRSVVRSICPTLS